MNSTRNMRKNSLRLWSMAAALVVVMGCGMVLEEEQVGVTSVGNISGKVVWVQDSAQVLMRQAAMRADQQLDPQEMIFTVKLFRGEDTVALRTVLTDTEGFFEFDHLGAGDYRIEATWNAFLVATRGGITLSASNWEINVQLEIRTQHFPGSSSSSSGDTVVFDSGCDGAIWRGVPGQNDPTQVRNVLGDLGGYWFTFSDESADGNSVIYPINNNDSIAAYIAANNAMGATFTLGSGTEWPYVGIGFGWDGSDALVVQATQNLDSKDGVCLTYASTTPVRMVLHWDDMQYGADKFGKDLPATGGNLVTIAVPWPEFAQEGWGMSDSATLATAVTRSLGIQFIQRGVGAEVTGESGSFSVIQMGWHDGMGPIDIVRDTFPSIVDWPAIYDSVPNVQGNIWPGENSSGINFGDDTGLRGLWYSYDDRDSQGNSRVYFGEQPDTTSVLEDHLGQSSVIEATLVRASGFDFPYAGIGIRWLGEGGSSSPRDISAHPGLCISYSADRDVSLRLEWDGEQYDYDFYQVRLPSTAGRFAQIQILWSEFAQEIWGISQPLQTALAASTGLQLQPASDGIKDSETHLKVIAVGWYGSCQSSI